jgi:hypothetical protein
MSRMCRHAQTVTSFSLRRLVARNRSDPLRAQARASMNMNIPLHGNGAGILMMA